MNSTSPQEPPQIVQRSRPPFWAKLGLGNTPPTYHPLGYHLLDVAAVLEAIWDQVLPEVVRSDLSTAWAMEPQQARAWLTYLAGLHDLGKLSPAFQLRSEAAPLHAAYAIYGWPERRGASVPHGLVTAIATREIFCGGPFDLPAPVAQEWAAVAGGHHGVFPTSTEMRPGGHDSHAVGQRPWSDARRALAEEIRSALGAIGPGPQTSTPASLMVAAGLVSVADWVGSDEQFFPYQARVGDDTWDEDLPGYLAVARERAKTALRTLGWFDWTSDPTLLSFAQLFPGIAEPRPLQQALVDIGSSLDSGAPELVVVEAPMGEGKTEAALYLAHAWATTTGRAGVYFALPTQATSDQMFRRLLHFLEPQPRPDHLQVQLLHGHAALSADLELLRRGGIRTASPAEVDIDGPMRGDLAASEWFTHRKRGLLAPYGVGTVDQSLLAVLQSKHVFVRLLGLVRRTVIVDEVHAYDTYMSVLLERLLEWLAALRAPVILLSATLPSERRRALCEAYARGLGGGISEASTDVAYPRVTRVVRKAGTTDISSKTCAASKRSQRSLALEWLGGAPSDGVAAVRRLLQERLADGGCAAVVCNTVGRAQEVYRALRQDWAGDSDDGAVRLELLHARFPVDARQVREQRLAGRFGPGRRRPDRAVVVATQVIEQSLDVDFDLMVSDMAPADLLLQRSGRLHRHDRTRPAKCAEPVLHILGPAVDTNGVPTFDGGTRAVYDEHVLLRSWLALAGRPHIAVPGDVQELIDEVYAPKEDRRQGLSAAVVAVLQELGRKQERARQGQWHEAESRWIKSPMADARVWEFNRDPREEDEPELQRAFQAVTRLTPPTVTIVCLEGTPDAPRLRSGRSVGLGAAVPEADLVRLLLGRALTVARPGLVQRLLEHPVPTGWRRSPLLRHCRPVVFDEAAQAAVGGYRLVLDDELGLVVNRG